VAMRGVVVISFFRCQVTHKSIKAEKRDFYLLKVMKKEIIFFDIEFFMKRIEENICKKN